MSDLELEMEDSKEKGYFISTRAIRIDWDNGRQTVLLTSLPKSIVDASEVVFSYFRRWPAQELTYRYEKATVSLSRVAGYGRKKVENPRQRDKQEKLAQKISTLTEQLKDAMEQRNVHEQAIAKLIPQEQRLRAKTKLVKGKIVIPRAIRHDFERCGKQIREHQKAINAIEKSHKDEFKQLTKNQREWLRLQGKEIEYAVDVELDQILTYFRASLVQLYAYFIQHFLGTKPLSLVGLLNRVLHLPASIEETGNYRRIILQANPQDPVMMSNLEDAIEKINNLKIQGPRGKVMNFSLR